MSFCLWGCPLSHGWRRPSVSAAASVGDGRSPLGCITRAGRREWTRVSEDGEGKLPAAPSHGLCGSAGGLPSQSPNGDSSPEGGAKSRLPLWGPQKSFARPQTQKKTPGGAGCLASYRERAAVLDPHVPRTDALLGAGQGPAKKFCPPQTQNKYPPAKPGVFHRRAKPYDTSHASRHVGAA